MAKGARKRVEARQVAIQVKAPGAREVLVTGSFIDWSKEGVRLSHKGSGEWQAVLSLEPGEYQYRLLVDGEWQDHHEALLRQPNPFGTANCVLKVM